MEVGFQVFSVESELLQISVYVLIFSFFFLFSFFPRRITYSNVRHDIDTGIERGITTLTVSVLCVNTLSHSFCHGSEGIPSVVSDSAAGMSLSRVTSIVDGS